ncbi:Mucin [Phytophthora megakarya]|uniref:Mucin n=1 Tax=Phytophthora megakarya TaxID=4795 RepID=A0A225VI96_9STRA|nr:Mucin [Phytophthora megakarya]
MKISVIIYPAVLQSIAGAGNPNNVAQQTPKHEFTPAPTYTFPSTSTEESPSYSTPSPMTPNMDSCSDIAVEGDAIYCIHGPVCSGFNAVPDGALCPVKGDVAVKNCIDTLPSWTGASSCVAPVDAVCARVSSGAWGCVFGVPSPTPTWVDITPSSMTPYVPDVPEATPTSAPPYVSTPTPTSSYVPDHQQYVPTTQQSQDRSTQQQSDGSSKVTQISTSTASKGESTTVAAGGVALIAAGIGVVLAVAGFGLYKYRQKVNRASLHTYEDHVVTPITTPV